MSMIAKDDIFRNSVDFVLCRDADNPIWQGIEKITPQTDVIGELYYLYAQDGVIIATSSHAGISKICTIFFFFEGSADDECEKFDGVGPSGLKSGMRLDDVKELMGAPQAEGGNFHNDVLGYQRPWIKYYPKPSVQIMVEFQEGKVWRASVGKAFREH